MRFGPVPLDAAEGAVPAHSLPVAGGGTAAQGDADASASAPGAGVTGGPCRRPLSAALVSGGRFPQGGATGRAGRRRWRDWRWW